MKRLLLFSTLLCALLLLLAAGLYGLREQLLGPRLLAALNAELAPTLGIELTVERIGGNYYNQLQLQNIRSRPLSQTSSATPIDLVLAEARVDYSLPALRHGLDPFLATVSVTLADGRLDLDLNAPFPAATATEKESGPAVLPLLPAIAIRDLDFSLRHGELELFAADLNLSLTSQGGPEPPAIILALESPRFRLAHPPLTPIQAPLQAELRGDLHSLRIESLRLGELLILDTARLEYGPGAPTWRFELAGQALGAGINLEGEGALEDGSPGWRGAVVIGGLELARLAELAPAALAQTWRPQGLLDLSAQAAAGPQPTSSDLTGELELHLRQASLAGYPVDDLVLEARLAHGLLRLEQLAARLGANHLRGSGLALDLAALTNGELPQLLAGSSIEGFSGELADLPALFTLAGYPLPSLEIPAHRLTFAGNLKEGVLQLNRADLDTTAGNLALREVTLGPWPESGELPDLPITGALGLRIDDLELFAALVPLPGLPTLPGNLAVDLELDRQRLLVHGINLQSGPDHLTAQGVLSLGELETRPRQRLPLIAWLHRLKGEDLRLSLEVAEAAAYLDLLPATWRQYGLGGAITASLTGDGTPDHYLLQGSLRLEQGRWQGIEVAELTLALTGGGQREQYQLSGSLKAAQSRYLELELERLAMEFNLAGAFAGGQPRGEVLLRAEEFAGPEQSIALLVAEISNEGSLEPHHLQGALRLEEGRWGSHHLDLLTSELTWREATLIIRQAELNTPYGQARLAAEILGLGSSVIDLRLDDLHLQSGEMAVSLVEPPGRLVITDGWLTRAQLKLGGPTATLALDGRYDPRSPGAELDLRGELRSDDLAWLAPLLTGVRRLEGGFNARFQLSGPPADPRLAGGFSLTGGGLRFTGDTPALRDLTISAEFDRNRLQLQEFTGSLGGAPFTVSGELEPSVDHPLDLAQLRLNLQLSGRDILFYRDEGIRVRGDGELNFIGPLGNLLVAGQIMITDGRYTKNVDFLEFFRGSGTPRRQTRLELFSLTTPPWRDLIFNIRLETATSFLVANNMARGSLRPVLTLGGTGELPVLTGEIYLDPIRVLLPSGRLTVESGLIRFPQADPDRPSFDINAGARLLGYDIQLSLQGNVDEPVLTLSSTPPLADDELLLLLLTGRAPAISGEEASRQAGMNIAVYLGRDLLTQWLSGDELEAEESIMERLDLEIGRGVSRGGQETIEASFLLTEDTLRRGDRLFITSERDIYDDFNVGLKIVFRRR
ncbi:translocation/assembly module TamB domain-containing protein [Desulfurivibrio sp. D14AmB]|uniref:translocation/assembly module TamB domain-containing protein n=1 Tax=Desulfurivibrio sp. D14AmB TaxID=3374370 RepID=UPI00376F0E38